ncbi:nucleoside monophosphate kinase [Candidatus Peregrinibacteria bacterium]|nr:nucleoside monophosphate kinase [Candidatus Peregrinibacteria bacterium]
MDFILFGMQGSGKGTQGKILAEVYDMTIFETGAALRNLAKQSSDLGKRVKNIIESGHLVPNEVVMEIVEDCIKSIPQEKNILFDGIPRKKEQSDSLNALLSRLGRTSLGILIEISEKEGRRRLSSRRICEQCKAVYPIFYEKDTCEKCGGKLVTRSDDTPSGIQTRIEAYNNETVPVIEAYRAAGKLLVINGEQSIKNVTEELLLSLRGRLKRPKQS